MNRENVLINIKMLIDVMLTKIDDDKDLSFLKSELTLSKNKAEKAEKNTHLELHAKGMARQVYDNFWDTKDIYYDFVGLDTLQNKFNQNAQLKRFESLGDVSKFINSVKH